MFNFRMEALLSVHFDATSEFVKPAGESDVSWPCCSPPTSPRACSPININCSQYFKIVPNFTCLKAFKIMSTNSVFHL